MIYKVRKDLLRDFGAVCISLMLFSCGNIPSRKASQPKQTTQVDLGTPCPKVSQPNQTTENSSSIPTPAASFEPDEFEFPSSARLIPLTITAEEVALREQQVQVAQELERDMKVRNQAGLATSQEVRRTTYFRLDSEIQLLQAKQLLRLKQQRDKTKS